MRGETNFATETGTLVEDAEAVIVFGSRNDNSGYAAVLEGANATYVTIQRRAPEATVVVIGPPWVNDNPPAWMVEARDAVRDAATARGFRFVDPLADRWFAETPGLIGADNVHPNDAGHAYLAEKLAPLVSEALAN